MNLAAALAELLDPTVEELTRDPRQLRAARRELDAEHLRLIRYLTRRLAVALAAEKADAAARARAALRDAGRAHRDRRAALRAETTTTPSLLDQLHDAVHSSAGTGNGSRGVHRSPLNGSAVELLATIARTVGCRNLEAHGPLCIRDWASHDDDTTAAEQLTSWVAAARTILDPPRRMEGTGACPRCGNRYVWVQQGDERIRRAAISMVITGRKADDYAECLNPSCDGRWPRTHWDLLAAALRAG